MSERMTSIHPRKDVEGDTFGMGYANYGRKTRTEMIEKFREYFENQRAQAELALSLTDDQLVVHTYLGPYAMRNREEVTE